MGEYENKYIDLLLNRCVNFNQCKAIYILLDLDEFLPFALKIKEKCYEMGIDDVYIDSHDAFRTHDYLMNTDLDDIEPIPLLSNAKRCEYAKKGAVILYLITSVPQLMDDVPSEKFAKLNYIRNSTNEYYAKNAGSYIFPWCLTALPNERWAKAVFPGDERSYEKLCLNIAKACMLDRDNPTQAWEEFINENNYYKNRLNELGITKLHFTNSLGTDLYVGLPEGVKWLNLDKRDITGGKIIVNMPSYEVFTSPDYRQTNGVVYTSKRIVYHDAIIDGARFVFSDGKVVDFSAEVGEDVLASLLSEDEGMRYLGEVSLVPFDSPISNTGIVFYETLFDENASCHIALGRGFLKTMDITWDDAEKFGINYSINHEDFMIGTPDMNVEAETREGKKLIFKKGNFNI